MGGIHGIDASSKKFVNKIFVIQEKITKILDHGNLELYGSCIYVYMYCCVVRIGYYVVVIVLLCCCTIVMYVV